VLGACGRSDVPYVQGSGGDCGKSKGGGGGGSKPSGEEGASGAVAQAGSEGQDRSERAPEPATRAKPKSDNLFLDL
jgi:hypothetical protein